MKSNNVRLKKDYYSLNEVARILDCEVGDLIHHANNDKIYFSVFIERQRFDEGHKPSLFVNDDVMKEMSYGYVDVDKASMQHISGPFENPGILPMHAYKVGIFDGWFYLGFDYNPKLEFDEDVDFSGYVMSLFKLDSSDPECKSCSVIISFVDGDIDKLSLPVSIKRADLFIDSHFLNVLLHGDIDSESSKTANKKGEIIPVLLKMIPELAEVDIDTAPAATIKNMLEVIARTKKLPFPDIGKDAWIKYLGRGK
ncbi:hypothetical protein [Enterobacter sp. PTB]|uniref:hypothetical protein n=1 Tax=Enterobacter sp. PTB TaxID=3143437 RepID=UPI003DA8CF94